MCIYLWKQTVYFGGDCSKTKRLSVRYAHINVLYTHEYVCKEKQVTHTKQKRVTHINTQQGWANMYSSIYRSRISILGAIAQRRRNTRLGTPYRFVSMVYIDRCIYMHIYKYIYPKLCIYRYIDTYIYIYIYIYTYIYTCVCVYVCIYRVNPRCIWCISISMSFSVLYS